MKILPRIAIIITILTTLIPAMSQELYVYAGGNMSKILIMNDEDVYSDDLDIKTGINIGFVLEFPLMKQFSLAAGASFVQKGFRIEEAEDGTVLEQKLTFNYLEAPVKAQYKVPIYAGGLLIESGLFIGFATGATASYTLEGNGFNESESEHIQWGLKYFSRLDYGLSIGAGIEFAGLRVLATYQHSIANLVHPERVEALNDGRYDAHRVVSITVGYNLNRLLPSQ